MAWDWQDMRLAANSYQNVLGLQHDTLTLPKDTLHTLQVQAQ